jgi:DNA polymerase-3 subunit alpha
MIKAGAMDCLGKRHHLLASVDTAMKWGKNQRISQDRGLLSLFGEMEATESAFEFVLKTDVEEISRKQLLAWEKELIGVYTSKHPLAYLNDAVKDRVTHRIGMINEEFAKQKVTLCGMITEARRLTTKKGDMMCIVKLEDMSGSISVTVFPKNYELMPELWVEDTVVIVRGEVQIRNDEPTILCDSAERFKAEAVEEEMNRKQYHVWLTIRLSGSDEKSISDDMMRVYDAYNCIRDRAGRDHYDILVVNGEWQVLLTPSNNTMHYSEEVHEKLEAVLGKGAVEVKVME